MHGHTPFGIDKRRWVCIVIPVSWDEADAELAAWRYVMADQSDRLFIVDIGVLAWRLWDLSWASERPDSVDRTCGEGHI
jgi:hypothetical protein